MPARAAKHSGLIVVFLFADQMHASAMDCMGNSGVLTPDLGCLAARGVLFRNCYSRAPLYAGRPVTRRLECAVTRERPQGPVRARCSDATAHAGAALPAAMGRSMGRDVVAAAGC